MYSMPVRTVWTFFTSPVITCPEYMLPRVESSHPGTNIGRFFSIAASIQEFFGSIWYSLFELAAAEDLVHELVRKVALLFLVGSDPFLEHRGLDAAHGFHFGNAGVGHAIHVAVEQRLLVAGREIAVVRNALVVIVRDEVEDVFFQIRAGAADGVDLVLTNHLGERATDLGGAHRTGDRDEHLAAIFEVRRCTRRRRR